MPQPLPPGGKSIIAIKFAYNIIDGTKIRARTGYERFKENENLITSLEASFEQRIAQGVAQLAQQHIEIRRAARSDDARLDDFFAAHFGDGWRFEAEMALRNHPPTLHLALRDGRILGFGAHSTQNREWGFFGPMGTAPECEGLGIGRVLLWLCLEDLRRAGHTTAVIPWVGPVSFYARHAASRVERVFWRYRLPLNSK